MTNLQIRTTGGETRIEPGDMGDFVRNEGG